MDTASPTPPKPYASVVVPAYNAAATITACVTALKSQGYDSPYEIIVVDDGSSDDTATLAEAAGARVLTGPRHRPAAARNIGIAAATGLIIACTDADCEPAVDWLAQLTAPLANPQIAAAKGTYATRQRSLVARFVQLEYEDKYDHMAGVETIDFVDTYSAAYRRETLAQRGGFDERFDYLEDQELSFRLAAAGEAMVFAPAAVVYHQHADTLWGYGRKKATIGYWKAQVVRRFPQRAIRDSHTPQVMKLQMLLAAMMLTALAMWAAAAVAGWQTARWAAAGMAIVSGLIFQASTLPFVAKAWRKDRAVALVSPFLLLVRAIGLGLGTVRGILAPPPGLDAPWPSTATTK